MFYVSILVYCVACFCLGYYRRSTLSTLDVQQLDSIVRVDTVYKEKVVERLKIVRDTIPQIKKETVLKTKYDTIKTVVNDRDTIQIPIEHQITQKVYSDDSTYTAYVSGCDVELDSITVKNREIEKIITNNITKEIVKEKKQRFGWSLGGGFQYDAINKKPSVGISFIYGIRF